jgi:hypothetical protein
MQLKLTANISPDRSRVCITCPSIQAGIPFQLHLKMTTTLSRLFANVAEEQGVQPKTLCFVFEQDLILPQLTAMDLELETGDQIIVVDGGTGNLVQDKGYIAKRFESGIRSHVNNMATPLMDGCVLRSQSPPRAQAAKVGSERERLLGRRRRATHVAAHRYVRPAGPHYLSHAARGRSRRILQDFLRGLSCRIDNNLFELMLDSIPICKADQAIWLEDALVCHMERATDLRLIQMLAAHGGGRREARRAAGRLHPLPSGVPQVAPRHCELDHPLHHVQFLTAKRVHALLASGADVHAIDSGADAPTPVGLARELLRKGVRHSGAQLVVDASAAVARGEPPASALAPGGAAQSQPVGRNVA